MNPRVKGLPAKECLNPGIRRSVCQTIDRSTHHKLEEVSTKAEERLHTTTNINLLLSIVDMIFHSKWKEDTVKLDTNLSTAAN